MVGLIAVSAVKLQGIAIRKDYALFSEKQTKLSSIFDYAAFFRQTE